MRVYLRVLWLGLLSATAGRADPRADVWAAVQALREASGYSWETTARQNAQEYGDFAPANVRLEDQSRVVAVRGRAQLDGYTAIVLPPSARGVDLPVKAFIKTSVRALAWTPLGWMTRQEMRDSPRAGETMEFEGKRVRLSRLFPECRRATNIETPGDELRGLLNDIDEFEGDGDEIVGVLQPGAAAILLEGGRRRASMTGELKGKVIFRIRDGVVREYEVRLETEIPREGRTPIRRIERWVTTLSEIGSTTVEPPPEVRQRLEAEAVELD